MNTIKEHYIRLTTLANNSLSENLTIGELEQIKKDIAPKVKQFKVTQLFLGAINFFILGTLLKFLTADSAVLFLVVALLTHCFFQPICFYKTLYIKNLISKAENMHNFQSEIINLCINPKVTKYRNQVVQERDLLVIDMKIMENIFETDVKNLRNIFFPKV